MTLAVRLVVFDWAGTTIDFGSRAPVAAFVAVFASHGIALTEAEVRGPMGLHKKDHIRALLRLPDVAQRFADVHHRRWAEADVEDLYRDTIPRQLEALDRHAGLTPGVSECVTHLRRRGVRIGATTGYFRAAVDRVVEAARRQGYSPDHSVGADDAPAGRPAPWMMFRIMEALGVYPPSAVVKVGDTPVDMGEGRSAGAWCVGVIDSSNEMGLSEEEFTALSETTRCERRTTVRGRLIDAGAHAVIDSLAQLPPLLDEIDGRMRGGEKP
jgi:phosphonoacetaldehyde hydrolase